MKTGSRIQSYTLFKGVHVVRLHSDIMRYNHPIPIIFAMITHVI